MLNVDSLAAAITEALLQQGQSTSDPRQSAEQLGRGLATAIITQLRAAQVVLPVGAVQVTTAGTAATQQGANLTPATGSLQ